MQTPALRKLLASLGFDEVAEHAGHVLLRSDKKQAVLPIREPLKPTTLRRFEGFSIRGGGEVAASFEYPPEPRFVVKLEQVEDEHWLATVPTRPGCLTQAKTLAKAVDRIQDALRLYHPETESFELDVSLDHPVLKDGLAAIEQARGEIGAARGRVDEAQQQVEAAKAQLEEAKARLAQAEAGVTDAEAGVGEAEGGLEDRTGQVIERLMRAGFDARDAALLLGKTSREISRLLKARRAKSGTPG